MHYGGTYAEQMQRIVEEYRQSGEPWPAESRQIAAWAVSTGRWRPQQDTVIARCAEDIAKAMREEYITDPQGRRVRAMHAARVKTKNGVQAVLWADLLTAPRSHMEIAFQNRRQQIVGDCRQLKTDADSYNDNANSGVPIQIVFDFTQDLAELEIMDQLDQKAALQEANSTHSKLGMKLSKGLCSKDLISLA